MDVKALIAEATSIDHALDRLFNCTEAEAHQNIKNRIYSYSVKITGFEPENIDTHELLCEIAHWLSVKSDDIFDREDKKMKHSRLGCIKEMEATEQKLRNTNDKLKKLFGLANNTHCNGDI